MVPVIIAILLIFTGTAALAIAVEIGVAYFEKRGRRVVVCPATEESASVELDRFEPLVPAAFQQAPRFHIATCSEWPERAGCAQGCVARRATAPERERYSHTALA